jgi:crotonobetainyl-CoA:carnitine CoA-transferase CaiB-like acyl-CoA transferase
MGALDGVRVLDLSRVLAGPWCTQVLADYGAEVIKVEQPGRGDDTRGWGPPWLRDHQGGDTSESAYFLAANRNKRSMAVDLASADGQAVVRELAKRADVLVENFKVCALGRYGLDYASLSAIHPGLVYCSITGYGQDGPDAGEPGYDALIQARGGLMSVTGHPDGEAGGGPMKTGIAVVDLMCGMYAATAILAALRHRDATGQGQHLDVPLLDTGVAWLSHLCMNHLLSGEVPARHGSAHASIVPYQAVATANGHLMLAVGNDSQFRRFAAVIGAPEWGDDPRFATNAARVAARAELVPLIAARLATRATADWLHAFRAAQVPAAPIQSIAEVFADPQVVHRGLQTSMRHPSAGELPMVAHPVRLSATPASYRQAPPLLGEHTDEVLAELGIDGLRIAELRALGVVG